MRQVDMSEASIAVTPGFCGALDVAQHRRGHGLPVGRSQQGEDPRFLAAQTLQPTWPLRLEEYRAGTQHEPVRRKGHYRVHWHGTFSRAPFFMQPFLQHASSPLFNGEYMERRSDLEPPLDRKFWEVLRKDDPLKALHNASQDV